MGTQTGFLEEINTALTEKLGSTCTVSSLSPIGGGCVNNASKMETNHGSFFLKWNPDPVADMFLREAEGLAELQKAKSHFLKIPDVIAASNRQSKFHFLILEYIKPAVSVHCDENLGKGLAEIHALVSCQFGLQGPSYCGLTPQDNRWKPHWPAFYIENRLTYILALIRAKSAVQPSDLVLFDRLFSKLPAILPATPHASLIHGDLWSGNYMDSFPTPALIDPAVCYADREMEFGMITLFGGFSQRFFDAYNEILPLEPDWKSRNRIYQLYHLLNHYLLFGGSYMQQAVKIAKSFV